MKRIVMMVPYSLALTDSLTHSLTYSLPSLTLTHSLTHLLPLTLKAINLVYYQAKRPGSDPYRDIQHQQQFQQEEHVAPGAVHPHHPPLLHLFIH